MVLCCAKLTQIIIINENNNLINGKLITNKLNEYKGKSHIEMNMEILWEKGETKREK